MKSSVESLLADDHESLGQVLGELDLELINLNVSRGFELLDLFWARLAVHIRAEHLHLFPALANAPAALSTGGKSLPTADDVQDVLRQLHSDHDFFMKELAEIVRSMRELAAARRSDYEEVEALRRQLMTIASRLEAHNKIEETQAYEWVGLLFDEETIKGLGARIRHELENLPPRLASTT